MAWVVKQFGIDEGRERGKQTRRPRELLLFGVVGCCLTALHDPRAPESAVTIRCVVVVVVSFRSGVTFGISLFFFLFLAGLFFSGNRTTARGR